MFLTSCYTHKTVYDVSGIKATSSVDEVTLSNATYLRVHTDKNKKRIGKIVLVDEGYILLQVGSKHEPKIARFYYNPQSINQEGILKIDIATPDGGASTGLAIVIILGFILILGGIAYAGYVN